MGFELAGNVETVVKLLEKYSDVPMSLAPTRAWFA
jgi:hypothetical protein